MKCKIFQNTIIMVKIQVSNTVKAGRADRADRADRAIKALRQSVRKVLGEVCRGDLQVARRGEWRSKDRRYICSGKITGTLNITLVDDKYIRKLNKKFRKKDKATDVLTFMLSEGRELLGDIYISVETAKRQAKEHGLSLKEELQRLAVHGTLHALGYCHAEMRAYGY